MRGVRYVWRARRVGEKMNRSTSRVLGMLFLLLLIGQSAVAQRSDRPKDFDRRADRASVSARAAIASSQQDALAQLRSDLGGSLIEAFDTETGVTRSLYNPTGFLTPATGGDATEIGLDFIRSNVDLLGLQPSDLQDFEITDTVYSAVSGSTYIYLRQRYRGLPVYNGQLQVHVTRDGQVSGVNNAFVPNVAALGKSATPSTTL